MAKQRDGYGFSLVELSIVLVILGLLVGGILAGQSLIHAAELRAVSSESQRYTTAVYSFRDKYFAIPGDFRNAVAFWGQSTACSGGSATGTCNGNGDGIIEYGTGPSLTSEMFQYWRQLALAGLIEGNYTGIAGSVDPTDSDHGTNDPISKLSKGGWASKYFSNVDGANSYPFNYNYDNALLFGAEDDNVWNDGPVLKPEDAWNIDNKVDDGLPGGGKVNAMPVNTCTNATGSTDRKAAYLLNVNEVRCALAFRIL